LWRAAVDTYFINLRRTGLIRGVSLNLYVMDLASGQTRQVTDGRYNSTEPTWFPDSQVLIITIDFPSVATSASWF
jgi:Tol biopolymer transport system component